MPNTGKKLPEKRNLTFPVVRYFIWKIQFLSNILSMIALTDFVPISNKYFFGGAVDTRGKPLLEGCSLFSSECETMLYLRKYGILNLRIIIFPRKKIVVLFSSNIWICSRRTFRTLTNIFDEAFWRQSLLRQGKRFYRSENL